MPHSEKHHPWREDHEQELVHTASSFQSVSVSLVLVVVT
jgi:hypothetical protein